MKLKNSYMADQLLHSFRTVVLIKYCRYTKSVLRVIAKPALRVYAISELLDMCSGSY